MLEKHQQIVLVHCTLADKAWQDVLRSSTVRYRPTRWSPDLVSDLSEFTAHQLTSEDFLSADKKVVALTDVKGFMTTEHLLFPGNKKNCWREHTRILCHQMVCTKGICGRVSIDTLDWHFDQNSIDISINACSTFYWHLINVGQYLAECWPTHIHWKLVEFRPRCWLSVNQDVDGMSIQYCLSLDGGYWSKVFQSTLDCGNKLTLCHLQSPWVIHWGLAPTMSYTNQPQLMC